MLDLRIENYNKIKKIITTKKNPIRILPGALPFISVDPETGERKYVATARKDIENRISWAKKRGIPVESTTSPPPQPASDKEVKEREAVIQELADHQNK
ncbi:MAG: hypothetical protein N2593_00005 [Patescibacteria group bacterium]|nr:hypothetical protein [Patescibacteria group bacterium]